MPPNTPHRDTCFYDGKCGLCRRSARVLHALDWLRRLDFVDQSAQPPESLPVDPDLALRGMPVLCRDGRVLVGYPAVRRALLQCPLAFLPALLLYIPGFEWVGRHVYAYVAANRSRDTCEIAAPRPGSVTK